MVVPRCPTCRASYQWGDLFCASCGTALASGLISGIIWTAPILGFGTTLVFGTLGAPMLSAWFDGLLNSAAWAVMLTIGALFTISVVQPERRILRQVGAVLADRTVRLTVLGALVGVIALFGPARLGQRLFELPFGDYWYEWVVWARWRLFALTNVALVVIGVADQGTAFFSLTVANTYRAIGRGLRGIRAPEYPHKLTVRIRHPMTPIERYERFAGPLDGRLMAEDLGTLTGGETVLEGGVVAYVAVELEVRDVKTALPVIREVLSAREAPMDTVIDDGDHVYPLRNSRPPPEEPT